MSNKTISITYTAKRYLEKYPEEIKPLAEFFSSGIKGTDLFDWWTGPELEEWDDDSPGEFEELYMDPRGANALLKQAVILEDQRTRTYKQE